MKPFSNNGHQNRVIHLILYTPRSKNWPILVPKGDTLTVRLKKCISPSFNQGVVYFENSCVAKCMHGRCGGKNLTTLNRCNGTNSINSCSF